MWLTYSARSGRAARGRGSTSPTVPAASSQSATTTALGGGSGTSGTSGQTPLAQAQAYSECMRSHGVPKFPDPQTTTGGIGVPGGFTFPTAGRNLRQKSPRYQAAAQACESLATHAKG